MRSFGTVRPTFWTGLTGRAIREAGADAQLLAVYLMTSPHANMLGCYYLPLVLIRKELALSTADVTKGLAIMRKVGFAAYDDASEVIWVYEMAHYQLGDEVSEHDKRLPAVKRCYRELNDCPFLGPFFDKYTDALHLEHRREGSQQKLQGHAPNAQGHEMPPVPVPVPDPVPVPLRKERSGEETAAWDRFERFWRAYPKRKGKDEAWKLWRKLNPDDALTDTIVLAVEAQCRGPDWLKEAGRFIPHPTTWLNRGGWKDEDTDLPSVSAETLRVVRGALDYTAGKR